MSINDGPEILAILERKWLMLSSKNTVETLGTARTTRQRRILSHFSLESLFKFTLFMLSNGYYECLLPLV